MRARAAVLAGVLACTSAGSIKVVHITAADQALAVVPATALGPRTAGEIAVLPDDITRDVMMQSQVPLLPAIVQYCIDERGHVFAVRVETSSGILAYDAQLERAVMGWAYRPYSIDGKPARVCSKVQFKSGDVRG